MIKLVTFKTNQTIIGDVIITDNIVKVKRPVQVIMQPSKDGPLMGFAPFLEYANEFEGGIEFDDSNILCFTTPVVELENQYNQIFGSGIQIATAIPKV